MDGGGHRERDAGEETARGVVGKRAVEAAKVAAEGGGGEREREAARRRPHNKKLLVGSFFLSF